ncbi:MAG: protein-L-isoaspartate(D-aspartate) O-methyltransferase [Verrucomicrobia bacterium]|nr:protein-L-isoaspartate(D-aspartate) O-methyltransferase [Verrucomicrobiota bacterium]
MIFGRRKSDDSFDAQRADMVEGQLRRHGIRSERVLDVMGRVPREAFVPDRHRAFAYADNALPVEHGQSISQPYMVALMTQALELEGPERVLEIGTGTGYQAAVLAALCAAVYSVERIPELAETARTRLADQGIANVTITVGDGTCGWPEHAPYDGIIVTAGAPKAPQPLLNQLAAGGRLVIPVGDRVSQMLKAFTKRADGIREQDLCACKFVPLLGAHGWSEREA